MFLIRQSQDAVPW